MNEQSEFDLHIVRAPALDASTVSDCPVVRGGLESLRDSELVLVCGGRGVDSGGVLALDKTISVDRIYRK